MTRPSEIKPREGSVAGTTYKQYQEGQSLGPITFDITPEICDEYFDSVQADRSLYILDGRQAASPTVLLPYMTVPIYQTYPPNQGIVMAELNMQWSAPLERCFANLRSGGVILCNGRQSFAALMVVSSPD